jgi:hypothetical protein
MSAIVLSMLVISAAAVVISALYVVSTQTQPGTVNPFGPGSADPASDTIQNEALVRTVFQDRPDWKYATLTRLSEVEDLLDSLENHNVQEREVHTLGNACFSVRWKC